MGIINKLKGMGRAIVNAFTKAAPTDMPSFLLAGSRWVSPPPVDTSGYLHVSVPLVPVENEVQEKLLGARYIRPFGKGQTYNVGANMLKRAADENAVNNKDKRRLRSKIRRWRNAEAAAHAA